MILIIVSALALVLGACVVAPRRAMRGSGDGATELTPVGENSTYRL
ncbi:MAG TPA: hypothetical protein VHI99_15185 [Vicinamibacterales bacterium]|jgi:hypothetical protein|nr:hypothetical protein [Vicinamibacterales bacterium]